MEKLRVHNFKNVFAFLIFIFAFTAVTLAQTPQFFNYDNGTSYNSFPFNMAAGKMIQGLVAPGEFNQPGTAPSGNITKFYTRVSTGYPLSSTYTTFKIIFYQAAITTLPASFYTGGGDTVYQRANVAIAGAAGTWLEFVLDHPYAYDNTKSLIFQIEQCASTQGSGFSLQHTTTPVMRRSYSVGGCPFSYAGQSLYVPNCGVTIAPPSCTFFPGWGYKAPITIVNADASAYSNLEVCDTVNTALLVTAGKMKTDGSDIRFCDSVGTVIPYWIQSGMNTATTIIWYKVPGLPASGPRTIWMYYGNPAATAVSNGMATFKFFEGFDGAVLNQFTAQTCNSGASAVVSGGNCAFTWTSVGQWVADTVLPQANIYVHEMNVTAATGNWPGIMSFNQGGATGGYATLMGSSQVRLSYAVAGTYCSGHNWANTPVAYTSVVGLWSVCWQATGTIWGYFPALAMMTSTNTSQTRNADQRLTIGGCSSGSGSVTVDWARARLFTTTTPGTAFGTEVGVPVVATGLAANPSGAGLNITLTWSHPDIGTVGKFLIQRSTDAGSTWAMKDSVNAPALTWTDVGPGLGQKCYRIAGKNCMGLGVYTTQACATLTGIVENSTVPKEFKLFQNSPNPFNPVTKINYDIPKTALVTLVIYDVLGKEIMTLVNEKLQPGSYFVTFDGGNIPSGTYFYRITAGDLRDTKKMILIK